MRESVNYEDIQEAYLFVKEMLQNNYYSSVNGKKDTINKTKKNKLNFVMEKIRQYSINYNTKNISKKNILEVTGEFMNKKDDIDYLIETLNYNGFLIKISNDEYKVN